MEETWASLLPVHLGAPYVRECLAYWDDVSRRLDDLGLDRKRVTREVFMNEWVALLSYGGNPHHQPTESQVVKRLKERGFGA